MRPLLKVRQVREFSDEPLDDEQIDLLADVARWSGSSQNTQPWRFIVIRDRDRLRQIGDAGLPQTRSLATAAAAIAVVLPDDADRRISNAFDEGRAAERVLAAATMLGLGAGIAWVRGGVRAQVGELLGLPEGRFVRTLIALGHPTPRAARPKSAPGEARLPREQTVFDEAWPAER